MAPAFFEPTTPLSSSLDIWSPGCTIFGLLAHRSLIDGILAQDEQYGGGGGERTVESSHPKTVSRQSPPLGTEQQLRTAGSRRLASRSNNRHP